MSFKFCPKCGKKEGVFIKGFCKECFLQDNQLILFPEKIQFQYCNRCNKVRVQRHWVEFDSINLVDFLKSRIKPKDFEIQDIEVELEEVNEKESNALIEVKGLAEGIPLILKNRIKLEKVPGICDSCMKISSDYFEATIQARFKEKNPAQEEKVFFEFQKLIEEMSKKDPLSRIANKGKTNNGFDLILSSNRAARLSAERIARKYNSKVVRSFSVVGVDKTGKEKRRYTYCVRV